MTALRYIFFFFAYTVLLSVNSCNPDSTPKPRGYFRISLPEKNYYPFLSDCPYRFDLPTYSQIQKDEEVNSEPCWLNIGFPQFKATLHISYKKVNGNLNIFTEDSRSFVYKHTLKADAINEKTILYPQKNLYGILYEIRGNAASSLQFFLTDSTCHFLRGALYFNVKPNKDSIAPVLEFLSKDISHLIETFEWK